MPGDLWRRLRVPWLAREDVEHEIEEELAHHLAMRAQELIDGGAEPGEAHARALESFGDVAATRRRYISLRGRTLRRARALTWLEDLAQDVRFGARTLWRRPAFTAMAAGVLALGIGAPVTVFTLVDTIFVERPAHVADPHRLVRLFRSWTTGETGGVLGNPDYVYYRDNARTISGLAAWGGPEPVAVVNQTLASSLWPGEDPIGRMFRFGGAEGFLVVGVARDATYYELGEAPWAQAYLGQLQDYQPRMHFLVRTDGDAAALAPAVQSALREIDPALAFSLVSTMDAVVEDQSARYEVSAVMIGVFGLVALLLAATGLYAVISHLVSGHTREFGIRMALGADRGMVARDVLRSGLRLAALGVALGVLGALALRGVTESLLYDVEAGDPLPLVAGGLTLRP